MNANKTWLLCYRRSSAFIGGCFLLGVLVITTIHVPDVRIQVQEDAIQHAIRYRDIPFIARPSQRIPPIAGTAPGTGGSFHAALNALRSHVHRWTTFHPCRQRWTKPSQSKSS